MQKYNIFAISLLLVLLLMLFGCFGQQQQQQQKNESLNESQTLPEKQEEEFYNIIITDYKKEYFLDEPINITAQVYASSPTVVPLIIVYGKNSVVFPSSINDYEFQTLPFEINAPGLMTRQINVNETGTYYARVYGFIKTKPYWSQEIMFEVKQREKELPSDVLIINITDNGLSNNEIRLKPGTDVKIQFVSYIDDDLMVVYPAGSFVIPAKGKLYIEFKFVNSVLIQINKGGKKFDELRLLPG
ncbi:MAG: hypothetical protein QXI89_00370 [Candidatus Anstonellales archaeon]